MSNLVLLVLTSSLPLLLVLLVVLWLLFKTQTTNLSPTAVMLELLDRQIQENQSLRNQLRAPDVMSLHGLQAATLSESPSSVFNEPSVDPDIAYNEYLRSKGLKEEELSDELRASGWDAVLSTEETEFAANYNEAGGTPVVFNRDE